MTKTFFTTIAAWAWATFGPAVPLAAACTAAVIGDVWSARRLARRIGRQKPSERQKLKFSSAKFGRVVCTLSKIYAALALTALVETTLLGEWMHLLKFVGALICFWQIVSILENEASCNSHPWAKVALRFLVDKTARYLKPDDLPKV